MSNGKKAKRMVSYVYSVCGCLDNNSDNSYRHCGCDWGVAISIFLLDLAHTYWISVNFWSVCGLDNKGVS